MRFLLDESVEYRLASWLSSLGHDVTAIAHDYPGALPDREVLETARRESRILITNDRDFGELIFRLGLSHPGVILLRLGPAPLEDKMARLGQVLSSHGEQLDAFLVVTPRGTRVRRPATP